VSRWRFVRFAVDVLRTGSVKGLSQSTVNHVGKEWSTTMLTKALVVKLTAKDDTREEVAAFLAGAVDLANQEEGTVLWLALRTDDSTFWIVDAFANDAGRQAHLDGPIAAALMEHADRLLALPPEIMPADALATKP